MRLNNKGIFMPAIAAGIMIVGWFILVQAK